jgi:hypothetical protein
MPPTSFRHCGSTNSVALLSNHPYLDSNERFRLLRKIRLNIGDVNSEG